jgi:hypothetical protein
LPLDANGVVVWYCVSAKGVLPYQPAHFCLHGYAHAFDLVETALTKAGVTINDADLLNGNPAKTVTVVPPVVTPIAGYSDFRWERSPTGFLERAPNVVDPAAPAGLSLNFTGIVGDLKVDPI